MRGFEICAGYQNRGVILPKRKTKLSAGYDISSLDDYAIEPHQTVIIETGLKVRMNDDEALLVFSRSSLGLKKGLRLVNSVAVIDADYYGNQTNDGHIMLSLFNFSDRRETIDKGERIAQGIFIKYLLADDDRAEGVRKGGYGSTGRI